MVKVNVLDLEASSDGGIFIIRSLRISYEVVPAGEHLPGESELTIGIIPSTNICIFSHSDVE